MDTTIKQHLLCATRQELNEYFDDVLPIDKDTDFKNKDYKFEIPTWTIKQQLDDIESKVEPKIGFVWYFLRKLHHPDNGTEEIVMGFRQEMVWIKRGGPYEPYIMKTINDLLQKEVNSRILEIK